MSNSSPPDPSPLKFDSYIAVFVAFTTINSLLYGWALFKQNNRFSYKKLASSPPDANPKSASEALPTPKPTPNAPESLSQPLAGSLTTRDSFSSSPNTDSSLSQKPSKPQASQENTSLASASDTAVSTPTPTAPTPTPVVEFSDVSGNSWASGFIKSLNKRKIVEGFSDRSFR